MTISVPPPTQAGSAIHVAAKPHAAKKEDGPAATAPSTTVTISAAAQAAQEAAETPAQTAQEARGNDRQAQRLVAKQQAAAKAYSGT
jgi:hypothetical protein